jgi:xylulokinase
MNETLAAIDVGSTTTRCVLYDLRGRSLGEAYREPPVYHPRPNWTEVAPEDWWTCVAAAIREALQNAQLAPGQVRAVGLCGLKHALVPVDAKGRPLARSMLWMDQRCRPQAEWLAREHGALIEQVMGGGASVSTTPSAPKLRWIVEHEPGLSEQTRVFLLPKDYIRFKLTGTLGTDPSDAGGTRLYDRRRNEWCAPLLARIGVSIEKFPPIYPSTHVAGGVTPQAADETGLAPGTPVVIGGGDVRSTLLGANALHTRRACLYLGTAAWLSQPPLDAPQTAPMGEPPSERPLRPDTFGTMATTGAALRWLRDLWEGTAATPGTSKTCANAPPASYAAMLREAKRSPPGAQGLVLLPHLMGERGPRPDPYATGTLYGLTVAHGQGDVTRALLEGCAYQLRRIAERMPAEGRRETVVVGGGAQSALWLQILADVLDLPLSVPRVLEAGTLGAAMVAGVGTGIYPSTHEAAAEVVEIADRIEPNPERVETYDQLYAFFVDLEGRVAPLYKRDMI